MKELSIEEKAKAYDKVREKIAIRFGSNVAEEIFSQFEMSEDEKIRKALIHMISEQDGFLTSINGVSVKDILAWLKRQGDQRPVISDDALREGIAHFGITQYQITNWLKKYVDVEKQDEQEATENSGKKSEDVTEEKDMSEYKKGFECGKQRVLKYPEDFGLCKSSAWSEEDRIRITNCIQLIGKTGDGEVEWLKSLESRIIPQPKQEWNEEDKNRFRNLIYLVEHSDEGKGTKEGFVKFINRLKSLRSQSTWEPSDEQIEAFEHFVRSIGESGFASPYDSDTALVYSLLDQLKKLREK